MTAQKAEDEPGLDDRADALNEVRLRGRLAAGPQERALPDGQTVWNLRLVVERPAPRAGERPRQRADWLECAVSSGRLRGQVARWSEGDLVEVAGALHRRFFRAGGATVSVVEVELSEGRLIRRARSG